MKRAMPLRNPMRYLRSQSAGSRNKSPAQRPSLALNRPVRERGEMVVQSLGLVLATVSATFATYMISNTDREPEFAGLEHLAIFSRPASSRVAARLIASREQQEVDFTPVGSISGRGRKSSGQGFDLLGFSSGKAVIQGPGTKISLVSQGDIIEGLGRVIAIERRGEKWVVVTSGGLIAND